MNCQTINQLTAWACAKAQGAHGEEACMLVPPVRFAGGSLVPVYVFDRGGQIEITDDGGLLESFHVSGLKLGADKRRHRGLDSALARWDVAVTNGEVQVWSKPEALGYALQRYLGAMFSAAQWQFENLGKQADEQPVMEEAELYLRALHPHSQISRNAKLSAVSGSKQNFPLKVDDVFFDSMSLHPASTAATVKKLFDVRNVRSNLEVQITMIVDDRQVDQKAKGDLNMVSILAHVQSFTALRDSAAKVLREH
jgi:hypothetical protein